MIAADEFVDPVKAQFNYHYLLEIANESSIRFCSFAIDHSSRTIYLCMSGRIRTGLGGLSTPVFDNFAAKRITASEKPGQPSYFERSMTMSPSTTVR